MLNRVSSIVDFLTTLYHAARGDGTKLSPYQISKVSSSRADSADASSLKHQLRTCLASNFRIYYPTHDTVATSTGGPPCGGTICFVRMLGPSGAAHVLYSRNADLEMIG